jgi:predicted nucleic acid-binding protein
VRTLFVDASYFVAIFNEDDEWHAPALRLGDEFARASDVRFVTTLAVLGEFLTSMSRRHDAMKTEAVAFVRRVLDRPQFEIVTVDRTCLTPRWSCSVAVLIRNTAWSTAFRWSFASNDRLPRS